MPPEVQDDNPQKLVMIREVIESTCKVFELQLLTLIVVQAYLPSYTSSTTLQCNPGSRMGLPPLTASPSPQATGS